MFQSTNQLNKIPMHEVSLETGFTGFAMIFNILPQRKLMGHGTSATSTRPGSWDLQIEVLLMMSFHEALLASMGLSTWISIQEIDENSGKHVILQTIADNFLIDFSIGIGMIVHAT